MTPELIQAMIAAIESGDPEAMKAVITEVLAGLAATSGDSEGAGDTPPPAAESTATNAADADAADAADDNDDEETNAVVRGLQATVNELLAEREARDLVERRSLVARLVKLGVETPATAWSGKPDDQKPCKRLMSEPIVDMRKRVDEMAAVRGALPAEPPARVLPGVETLSAAELAACKKRGIDPADYIARKASAVKTRRSEVTQ